MEILTLSQAKPRMGRLIDRALHGESVLIRKGSQLGPFVYFVCFVVNTSGIGPTWLCSRRKAAPTGKTTGIVPI